LATSKLKNITYNTNTVLNSGSLSSLYTGQIIDFKALSSNTMVFQFDTIQTHKRLLVRARVRGECSTNNSISMTLSGTTQVTVPAVTLTAGQ
jgi:hypothetical protein